jgi:hypothetical protein
VRSEEKAAQGKMILYNNRRGTAVRTEYMHSRPLRCRKAKYLDSGGTEAIAFIHQARSTHPYMMSGQANKSQAT